jgi:hypothetical protein
VTPPPDLLPDKVRRLEARVAQLEDAQGMAARRRPLMLAVLDPATREVALWVCLFASMSVVAILIRRTEGDP